MDLTIFVPIKPRPASRPRTTIRNGRVWTYPVNPYKDYKKGLEKLLPTIVGSDFVPLEIPLCVMCDFVVERPKTTKLSMPGPDIDNYEKALYDAGNGILWADDKLIGLNCNRKRWTLPGESEGVWIRFCDLEKAEVSLEFEGDSS